MIYWLFKYFIIHDITNTPQSSITCSNKLISKFIFRTITDQSDILAHFEIALLIDNLKAKSTLKPNKYPLIIHTFYL